MPTRRNFKEHITARQLSAQIRESERIARTDAGQLSRTFSHGASANARKPSGSGPRSRGRSMYRLATSLVVASVILLVAAGMLQLLWKWCGMGAWTGLGELPFAPAIFLSFIFAAPFAAK